MWRCALLRSTTDQLTWGYVQQSEACERSRDVLFNFSKLTGFKPVSARMCRRQNVDGTPAQLRGASCCSALLTVNFLPERVWPVEKHGAH
jgi:hypothetical protein